MGRHNVWKRHLVRRREARKPAVAEALHQQVTVREAPGRQLVPAVRPLDMAAVRREAHRQVTAEVRLVDPRQVTAVALQADRPQVMAAARQVVRATADPLRITATPWTWKWIWRTCTAAAMAVAAELRVVAAEHQAHLPVMR